MNSIKTAFKSLYRNISMSVASFILVTLTLLVLSTTIILTLNISNVTDNVFQSLRINVYLKDDLSDEDLKEIKKEIELEPNISTVTYSSKEDELANVLKYFDELDKDEKSQLEEVLQKDNPVSSAYIVNLKEIGVNENKTDAMKLVSESIAKINGVDSVDYGAEAGTDSLIRMLDFIKIISDISAIALLVISIFLITNTVKLTINARRKEIGIMRLVGAKSWYIKVPFVIEGMIIGLIGGVFAYILSTYGYSKALDLEAISFLRNSLVPANTLRTSILMFIPLIGMAIGSVGSSIAIRGYLKV